MTRPLALVLVYESKEQAAEGRWSFLQRFSNLPAAIARYQQFVNEGRDVDLFVRDQRCEV